MATLPGGTVTFLFTDIEGSTRLLQQLGDAYGDVVRDHRQLLREHLGEKGGTEVDTQCDVFFYSFPRARDAVAGAVAAQRGLADHEWPDGAEVNVRMGLHTGEPSVGDEGYLGLDVVRAARICTVAHGGQILLSESTRALLGSAMPDDVSVFPLGERQLRSIDEPERIYELAIVGLHPEQAQDLEEVDKAPASRSASDDEFDREVEDLSARFAARIQQGVLRSLEGALGRSRPEEPDDADVEDIASRASALQERIAERVEEALRARKLPRDGSS
jgi:class 3 adenylate cyclase